MASRVGPGSVTELLHEQLAHERSEAGRWRYVAERLAEALRWAHALTPPDHPYGPQTRALAEQALAAYERARPSP